MSIPVRVVINCAGEGRRLGLGTTKVLVSVLDEPIISWHLRMLEKVDDVVVVVGFQSTDVIDAVRAIRRDVVIAFNHDYASTGTAASLAIGARGAKGDVISLDGDLLVHPEDFALFLRSPSPCLGVTEPITDNPVFVTTREEEGGTIATAFRRTAPGLEWTGLVRVPAAAIAQAHASHRAQHHVYEMLEPFLPIPALPIRVREIDTADDYERAVTWFASIVGVNNRQEVSP